MMEVLKEVTENGGVLANGDMDPLKKWPLADDFAALMREHLVAKEMLAHSEEQLRDLKAEQNNTRVRREGDMREKEEWGECMEMPSAVAVWGEVCDAAHTDMH